jgi:hypothetical protein
LRGVYIFYTDIHAFYKKKWYFFSKNFIKAQCYPIKNIYLLQYKNTKKWTQQPIRYFAPLNSWELERNAAFNSENARKLAEWFCNVCQVDKFCIKPSFVHGFQLIKNLSRREICLMFPISKFGFNIGIMYHRLLHGKLMTGILHYFMSQFDYGGKEIIQLIQYLPSFFIFMTIFLNINTFPSSNIVVSVLDRIKILL